MNCRVWMDGADTIHTAFVTGHGHDVILGEATPAGCTIEVQDRVCVAAATLDTVSVLGATTTFPFDSSLLLCPGTALT